MDVLGAAGGWGGLFSRQTFLCTTLDRAATPAGSMGVFAHWGTVVECPQVEELPDPR